MLGDGREQRGWLCVFRKHESTAGAEDRQYVGRCAMGQRRVDEITIVRREAISMALRHDIRVPRPARLHHAFWNSRCAASELYRDRGIERNMGAREARLVVTGAMKYRVLHRSIEHVGCKVMAIDASSHRLVDQHGRRLDIFDDALQFGIAVARIERNPGLSRGQHGKDGNKVLDGIPASHAYSRLRTWVFRLQIGSDAHDLAGKLRKGHTALRRDHCHRIRRTQCGAKEKFNRMHQARPRIVTTVAASSTPKKPPPFSAAAKRAFSTCRAPASPRSCITSS